MKQQFGGTLAGFLVGIVVGLGAALAVAVYVTKVPVPFINKDVNRPSDQDAAKNNGWNPNASLYGKNPAAGASAAGPVDNATGGAGRAPGGTAGNLLPPAVVGGNPPPVAAARPPAASADPLGDFARAKSSSSDAGAFTYFVQAGAFRSVDEAESQRAKLSLMGVEAKVSQREQAGRTVWRVRVGPFDTQGEADRTKQQLETSGMETALVRVQR
ncbi:MAG: Cell division protein FtsN [Burkholderiaceae bacterium]|jgi:cell division protein FtsN|nr:MAG: Cell division protein FtsN [Burkholderiaceae bacterium]